MDLCNQLALSFWFLISLTAVASGGSYLNGPQRYGSLKIESILGRSDTRCDRHFLMKSLVISGTAGLEGNSTRVAFVIVC